jgi:hypothetical protein
MKRIALMLCVAAFACGGPARADQAVLLSKANVLPLALDEAFKFRKTEMFLNDPKQFRPTVNPMILFERRRKNFKAVSEIDKRQRMGHYFTFFWRADREAGITVRLEYRQENLGAYVQAREISYPNARGSMTTRFEIVGDDYKDDGRISAWRALLIEGGKIVALTQSQLWN